MKTSKRRFMATDAIDIKLRDLDAKDLQGVDLFEQGIRLEQSQFSVTLVREDGVIIASGGALCTGYGIAQGWMLTSDLVPEYALQFLNILRLGMRRVIREFELVRIETTVLPEHAASIRMLEAMGFLCEGYHRKCGPNHLDRYTFAWVV